MQGIRAATRVPGVLLVGWAAVGCGTAPITVIPEEVGLLGIPLGRVAVVTGDDDRIEETLTLLEVPFELYDGFILGPPPDAALTATYQSGLPRAEQLVGNAEALSEVDLLFINCGARGTGLIDPYTLETQDTLLREPYRETLQSYVEGGGQLIVSDRSYNLVEALFPALLEFAEDDGVLNAADLGAAGSLEAEIQDSGMRTEVGSSLVRIELPLSGWALLERAEGVLVRGDAPVRLPDGSTGVAPATPLLVHLEVGRGGVTFSSFHLIPRVDAVYTELQIALLRFLGDG